VHLPQLSEASVTPMPATGSTNPRPGRRLLNDRRQRVQVLA
jgi:hypothetical protein